MKKTLFILIFAISVFSVFVSCNNNTEVVTYKVTVKNGEVLYKEKNVAEGDIYVLPSKPADSRPFKGWKVGESTELMQPGEDLKITGDTEITAVWVTSCTVSFNLCDSSLDKIDDETVAYGAHAKEPLSSSIPDRTGYAFAGWYLNEEKYEFDTATVTENITLKAHWTANYYTVTFDTNGGEAMSPLEIPYGEKMNFLSNLIPSRTGYTFNGWKLNGENFTSDNPVADNITLVADWSINKCTVSFNLGYSTSKSIPQQSVEYGSKADKVTEPTRKGYLFSGWKIDGAGTFDFENPITSNISLTAQWTQIKTSLTLYFPKNVNFIDTIIVKVGKYGVRFKYADGTADGDWLKYTGTVTGLDYDTYDIKVTTINSSGETVGGSYSDTVTLSSPVTEKEVKVTSDLVDITPTVTTTTSSVTDKGDGTYLVKGTVSFSYIDGVSIEYSTDGNTPSTLYSSGDKIDVDSSTTLRYTVSYSKSSWTKGTVSYSGVIDKNIKMNAAGLEGPAGGTIIYDAGKRVSITFTNSSGNSDGYTYRFIEAAPTNCSGTYPFGGYGKSYNIVLTVGYGRANTVILEAMSDYSTSAAKAACDYEYGNYTDWYLPSFKELRLIMLYASKVGGLSGSYWSSSDVASDSTLAYYCEAGSTTMYSIGKTSTFKVRAVRYF